MMGLCRSERLDAPLAQTPSLCAFCPTTNRFNPVGCSQLKSCAPTLLSTRCVNRDPVASGRYDQTPDFKWTATTGGNRKMGSSFRLQSRLDNHQCCLILVDQNCPFVGIVVSVYEMPAIGASLQQSTGARTYVPTVGHRGASTKMDLPVRISQRPKRQSVSLPASGPRS